MIFSLELDFQIEYLGLTAYRQVVFKLKDFLTFQNPTVKLINYYQIKKMLNFFTELQINFLITFFNNQEFESLVAVTKIKLMKFKQQKC